MSNRRAHSNALRDFNLSHGLGGTSGTERESPPPGRIEPRSDATRTHIQTWTERSPMEQLMERLVERLTDDQLEAFDTESVNDQRWIPIHRCLDRDFPDGQFTFLDLGGGNGTFADRLLEDYPSSSGVVLDNSQLLLNRNKPH